MRFLGCLFLNAATRMNLLYLVTSSSTWKTLTHVSRAAGWTSTLVVLIYTSLTKTHIIVVIIFDLIMFVWRLLVTQLNLLQRWYVFTEVAPILSIYWATILLIMIMHWRFRLVYSQLIKFLFEFLFFGINIKSSLIMVSTSMCIRLIVGKPSSTGT